MLHRTLYSKQGGRRKCWRENQRIGRMQTDVVVVFFLQIRPKHLIKGLQNAKKTIRTYSEGVFLRSSDD